MKAVRTIIIMLLLRLLKIDHKGGQLSLQRDIIKNQYCTISSLYSYNNLHLKKSIQKLPHLFKILITTILSLNRHPLANMVCYFLILCCHFHGLLSYNMNTWILYFIIVSHTNAIYNAKHFICRLWGYFIYCVYFSSS